MVVAAFFQRHLVPVVQRVACLADEGVHVLQYLDFALGERATTGGIVARAQLVGDAGQGLKVEMPQLVDEGREVGFLQERYGVGIRVEGSARGGGVLVVDVGVRRVKRAGVTSGGFDLVGFKDNE